MSANPLSRAGRKANSADPANEATVADFISRTVAVDLVAAALVAVPPTICLLAIGFPAEPGVTGWLALAGPIVAAAAVLVCRRHLAVAAVLLTIAMLCVPAAEGSFDIASPLVQFFSLSPLIAVAVVYCAIGARLALAPSLTLMGCSAIVQMWAAGDDVAFLLIGLGWWFVGRVLRSRVAVADNLRIRAAELAAERDRFTAEAVALERTKIARELHDVVAHCMTVIVIQSRAGRQLLGSDPQAAREAVDVIVAVTAEAEADIAALVALMNPESSRPLTRGVLEELVARASVTGASITVDITGDPEDLAPDVAIAAHRLVQESLTNCLRHAPGADITIELSCDPTTMLRVVNSSATLTQLPPTRTPPPAETARPGFDSRPAPLPVQREWAGAGKGLIGIRERIAETGGEVSWGPTDFNGWQVCAVFAAAHRSRQ